MEQAVKTGDQVQLTFASHGHQSGIKVNGVSLDGARAMKLETSVNKVTLLTVEAYVPTFRSDPYTFSGFFVSEDDMQAFLLWKQETVELWRSKHKEEQSA